MLSKASEELHSTDVRKTWINACVTGNLEFIKRHWDQIDKANIEACIRYTIGSSQLEVLDFFWKYCNENKDNEMKECISDYTKNLYARFHYVFPLQQYKSLIRWSFSHGLNDYYEAMNYAAQIGDIHFFKEIKEQSPEIFFADTYILSACQSGNDTIVQYLLDEGAIDYEKGFEGACYGGNKRIAKWMKLKGANNLKRGVQCLIYAVINETDTRFIFENSVKNNEFLNNLDAFYDLFEWLMEWYRADRHLISHDYWNDYFSNCSRIFEFQNVYIMPFIQACVKNGANNWGIFVTNAIQYLNIKLIKFSHDIHKINWSDKLKYVWDRIQKIKFKRIEIAYFIFSQGAKCPLVKIPKLIIIYFLNRHVRLTWFEGKNHKIVPEVTQSFKIIKTRKLVMLFSLTAFFPKLFIRHIICPFVSFD